MKKISLLMQLIFCILFLNACNPANMAKNLYYASDVDDRKANQIVKALSENDKEAFEDLFCTKVRNSEELDVQIQEAMDFFVGTVEKSDYKVSGGETTSYTDGKISTQHIISDIENIVTSEGKKYNISFHCYTVNDDDEDKVGISELTIESSDGYECVVGEYIP